MPASIAAGALLRCQAKTSSTLEFPMLRALALAFVVALAAVPASAAEVAGVNVKDTATVAGKPLVLNGAGLRTKVVFKVYVASLYLPAKAADLKGVLAGGGPRRVQLNMQRTLSADTFVEAFEEGLKNNNSAAELEAVKEAHAEMTKIMKGLGEVKEGSVVTFDFVDGATSFAVNGVVKGSMAGDAFNVAFLKIWLGSKPVQDDLKKILLGG